jgi:type IV pilus assembly protein PilX
MNRVPSKLDRSGGIRGSGAALFISLVFLLILTVIGLAGMQNTSLQEKMAGHLRERSLAFQAAESALRAGETYLATSMPAFVCNIDDDGLYINSTPGSSSDCPTAKGSPSSKQTDHPYPPDNENFWKDNSDVRRLGDNSHQYDQLAEKPKYVLEVLSSGVPGAAVTLEAGIPVSASTIKYYRITARGVGRDSSSVVVTQSVVRQ